MQVIGPDGAVLASSANARGLLAIIDDLDDDASEFEISGVRLREEAQKESSHDAASANSGDSAEGEARDASAAAVDASGQNDDKAKVLARSDDANDGDADGDDDDEADSSDDRWENGRRPSWGR